MLVGGITFTWAGDLERDWDVDGLDLASLATAHERRICSDKCPEDQNNDGFVDNEDLEKLAGDYGASLSNFQ